jgi:hypothetical protein
LSRAGQAALRAPSFYKAFDAVLRRKGFSPTRRFHWSRPCGCGAVVVCLDMRPLSHDYEIEFGVTYSRRPPPERLNVFDCVACGTPGGLTSAQVRRWRCILDDPVSSAKNAKTLDELSALLDLRLAVLRRWTDPRRLYRDLHRGRAVAMLVHWRRFIAACRRYDHAEGIPA